MMFIYLEAVNETEQECLFHCAAPSQGASRALPELSSKVPMNYEVMEA